MEFEYLDEVNNSQILINIIDTHNDNITLEKYTEKSAPVLSYSSGESRFSSFMSSKFSFNILNETGEDGKFLDLLTGEERRFFVELRYLSGFSLSFANNLIWSGFLLPDVYTEPYQNGAFFVNFTATDGLDVLKTRPFTYYKTNNVISYIAKCLLETGLNYNIYFAPGVENAFYTWANIQIFEECFTEFKESVNKYQYTSCYDVLDKLLKAVGATVYQHAGRWFIIGYNRKQKGLDEFAVYNCFGDFLRNESYFKELKRPRFNNDVAVTMASPYKTVELNVTYQESEKAIDLSKFVKNDTLSTDEYTAHQMNKTITTIEPFNYWKKNAACTVGSTSEDNGTYLRVLLEGNVIHHPSEYPVYYNKPPYCVSLLKTYGPPHSFENDWIELKADNTLFVSPQVAGRELTIDVDFEFKIMSRVDEQKFNEDFYSQAFRIDLRLDDDVVFSTRAETDGYESSDTKITFEKESIGPEYLWYTFPNYPPAAPNRRERRFSIPASLKAQVVRKAIKTDKFGKLNVRVYLPKNADGTFATGQNDFHVSNVVITKLDLKIKDWDSEQYQLSREIRYTTKYQNTLSFGDGKNDLYKNLFKINDRNDYASYINRTSLYTGSPTEDNLYYYFEIFDFLSKLVAERYESLVLHSGTQQIFAYKLFGKMCTESGIEMVGNVLKISKARIDEFPMFRESLININQITVGSVRLLTASGLSTDVQRERYINWKRSGSSEQLPYLHIWGRMIHECTASQRVGLEGTALAIIYPHDLVQFNFQGNKTFIPTSLNINFSTGKTRVTMTESVFQNLIDYSDEQS